jgi:hypothetical protein
MSQQATASRAAAATEGGDPGAQRGATEDAGGATVQTKIGNGLSGLLGVGIIVIGARFLVAPRAAAAGYGIATEQGDPYLAVKGVRDIASGVAVFALLAAGKPRALGRYLAAASIIRSATRSPSDGATARRQLHTACTAPRQRSCWARPRSCSADPSDIPWRGAGKPARRGFSSGAAVSRSSTDSLGPPRWEWWMMLPFEPVRQSRSEELRSRARERARACC